MSVIFLLLTLFEVQSQSPINNYLALGDSYTIGESVAVSERWPNQLVDLLAKDGRPISHPAIIATTGWRTDNLANAITIARLKEEYDLVSLLIGVNNQYQGKSVDQFEIEFQALLKAPIRLAKEKKENVFVVSIPDYGFTPFGEKNKEKISLEIDKFNAVCKKTCNENNISFIDIVDISREGLIDTSLVASDGLHPSGKMYARWAERIAKEIKVK